MRWRDVEDCIVERSGTPDLAGLVRGKGFIAGWGEEGYRVNVRSFIKRIRQKFRAIDDAFDCIKNYSGYGYYWDHGE